VSSETNTCQVKSESRHPGARGDRASGEGDTLAVEDAAREDLAWAAPSAHPVGLTGAQGGAAGVGWGGCGGGGGGGGEKGDALGGSGLS
jgi:hypothetical protein